MSNIKVGQSYICLYNSISGNSSPYIKIGEIVEVTEYNTVTVTLTSKTGQVNFDKGLTTGEENFSHMFYTLDSAKEMLAETRPDLVEKIMEFEKGMPMETYKEFHQTMMEQIDFSADQPHVYKAMGDLALAIKWKNQKDAQEAVEKLHSKIIRKK